MKDEDSRMEAVGLQALFGRGSGPPLGDVGRNLIYGSTGVKGVFRHGGQQKPNDAFMISGNEEREVGCAEVSESCGRNDKGGGPAKLI